MAAPVFVLQVMGPDTGPWTISLGPPGTRPASGLLPPEAVERLVDDITELAARPGRVLVPGRDRKQVRAEAAIGQRLLRATSTSPDLLRAWGVAAARLGDHGGVVLIDAHPLRARALPWELLAHTPDAPPMALAHRTLIARLCPGPEASPTSRSEPVPAVWRLGDTADPIVEQVVEGLQHAWSAPLSPPKTDTATWLHVIAHGAVDDTGTLALQLGTREADSSVAMDQLAPHLSHAVVTLLAVCHGGGTLSRTLAELPAQLVHAGAPVVVGSADTVSPEALSAFTRGLADSTHNSVLDAIAAGWRSVRAAALPWPDARWHRLRVFVPRVDGLQVALAPTRPGIHTLLAAARVHADTLLSGYCGLEHLLLALIDVEVPRSLAALRYRARLHRQRIQAQLGALRPGVTAHAPDWSPRLRAHLASLPPHTDLEGFWRPLLRSASPLLAELLDLPAHAVGRDASFDTVGTARFMPSPPATHLEVLGGPEDGRFLTPSPGDWIGRPSSSAPSAWSLYEGTPLIDPRVSRQHVQWVGPGRLQCRRPVRVGRVEMTDRVELHVGQVLHLGGATRLVGRSDDG